MSVIPEAAVEAAAKWLHDHDCRSALHSGFPPDFECYDWLDEARELLEAAAPHMLSHERQQTADADRDARVNARTVDKLNAAVEKVLLACDAMDEGVRIQSGDQRTSSFAAKAIRAAINDALSR